ncbi:hypothetical protein LXL04_012341 [Taraxacum kok-saghyz]
MTSPLLKVQESTMTTHKTYELQIDHFCNCEGHIKEVKDAFREVGGVKLSAMNPDKGKFTIITTKHPDEIKNALKRTFAKKKITIFEKPKPASRPPSIHNHQNLTINNYHFHQETPPEATHFDDMARALKKLSHVPGVESAEIAYMKVNYKNSGDRPPSRRSRPETSSTKTICNKKG